MAIRHYKEKFPVLFTYVAVKSMQYSTSKLKKDEEDKTRRFDSWRCNNDFNTEGYDHIIENPFLKTNDNPLSTFFQLM